LPTGAGAESTIPAPAPAPASAPGPAPAPLYYHRLEEIVLKKIMVSEDFFVQIIPDPSSSGSEMNLK
jgi:hypothetical protein